MTAESLVQRSPAAAIVLARGTSLKALAVRQVTQLPRTCNRPASEVQTQRTGRRRGAIVQWALNGGVDAGDSYVREHSTA